MANLARHILSSVSFGGVAASEAKVARHVPYLRHVAEDMIKTKEGHFLMVAHVGGICFQTADQAEIDLRLTGRNTIIRAMYDSRFAIYSHIVRREVHPTIGGQFDNFFCAELDQRYMAAQSHKRMFVNDLYVTIIRRGFQGKVGLADSATKLFRKGLGVDQGEIEREARQELRDTMGNFAKELASYNTKILGCRLVDGVVRSEICEFLAQIINGGCPIKMALPRMALDEYLPTKRITFGKKALEVRGATDADTRFGAMLSIREYPAYSGAGMLDGLLRIPHEFIIAQSFALEDRAPVLSSVARVQRQIGASDEAGTEVEEAINIARNELVTGATVLGYHHLTVQCLGRTIREMEKCVQEATQELQGFGTIVVREDMNAEPAFWAQLPGNLSYIARRALISSRNFVGFTSLHNFAVGQRDGNRWGPAISILETTSQTPYYFNFHRRQVGNFTVCGPTGAGKTVGLGFLLAQAMRVAPRPRIAFFDKDRGADPLIRAMGGSYETLNPGVPTGFNPLQLEGTPDDRAFLTDLLKFLVRPTDGTDLSAQQIKIVESAVEQIFTVPKHERRFRDVAQLLSGAERQGHSDLASRFDVWTKARGWLFDNPVDTWSAANGIFGFDMSKVLDDEDVRTAALGYIFHRIEQMMDGTPMMLFIDEGWKILTDNKFAAFLNDKLKTIRKLNGIVGFGTQSAKDIVSSAMGHTLLEQTPTNIFFPNPKADFDSYVHGFKLSERELHWVQNTHPDSRQFLVKHDQDSVIARLDLSAMLDIVKVLSGNVESVEECERIRAEVGDDPRAWLPIFCGWKKEHGHVAH
ncbi:type IV secretion system protein VirB4 [Rhodoblastus acidophilus]|uniref:VirB4 family type IV secretion/conjugal transfer ATPase n=1 Tax=Rhodoblastus acidophilus TaxID=1074 RepID=UPI002224BB11|nr:VirB4 family type IV secretion/conjugal transfer ATPase [Rhodoblastus acidophilus]MCW2286525.1 type IV secretion system protein VirB4 [Rhodoblastus acidophilus]MCW2335374.1 type IV secretion system protein VirB4 [Rhodoblastus acidophilus]